MGVLADAAFAFKSRDRGGAFATVTAFQGTADVTNGVTDARAAIVAADGVGCPVYFSAGTYAVASNLTVTHAVMLAGGAILKPASGVTVTLNGALTLDNSQHFDLSAGGVVAFGTAVVEHFLPQWWGAVGDGVTADTAAIQAALDACLAAGGGTVRIPRGSYNVTSLTLAHGSFPGTSTPTAPHLVSVVGDGQASQINITNTSATAGLTVSGSGYFPCILLQDFVLSGNELAGDGILIDQTHHRSVIRNVVVLNFPKAGTGSVPVRTNPSSGVSGYAGIRLRNAINVRIDTCFADNVNTGLILEAGSDGCVITDFTCYGYKRAGIDLVVGQDPTGTYRTPYGTRIASPYFYGSRAPTGAASFNYLYTPTDSSLGLAADGSNNGRYGIKSEGAPLLQIDGGWFEATEWAIFCGDYSTDLSGVGGDGAGVGTVTQVNNNNLYVVAPKVGGSYTPKIYLRNPVGGFHLQTQTFPLTVAGGTDSLNRITSTIHLRGDLDDSVTGGFRQTIDGWYQDNVPAGQAATVMQRFSVGANGTIWFAPRAGSITGLLIRSSGARTAGTMTATVYKNGVATALTAVLDGTNTFSKFTSAVKDLYTFASGDYLQVYLASDGSWAPTTADIRASVEVET